MPAARLDAIDRGLKARTAHIWIVDAAGCEVKPDAADARLVHGLELTVRCLVVDHGNATRDRDTCLHAELGCRVVGAGYAWGDDPHAFYVQRLVRGRRLFGRRRFRGVDAPG